MYQTSFCKLQNELAFQISDHFCPRNLKLSSSASDYVLKPCSFSCLVYVSVVLLFSYILGILYNFRALLSLYLEHFTEVP